MGGSRGFLPWGTGFSLFLGTSVDKFLALGQSNLLVFENQVQLFIAVHCSFSFSDVPIPSEWRNLIGRVFFNELTFLFCIAVAFGMPVEWTIYRVCFSPSLVGKLGLLDFT